MIGPTDGGLSPLSLAEIDALRDLASARAAAVERVRELQRESAEIQTGRAAQDERMSKVWQRPLAELLAEAQDTA